MVSKYQLQEENCELINSDVWRGGKTAPARTYEPTRKYVHSAYKSGDIDISFNLSAAGGGVTKVDVTIPDDDYRLVLGAMFSSSPEVFINEYVRIGHEISKYLSSDVVVSGYIKGGKFSLIDEIVENEHVSKGANDMLRSFLNIAEN